MSRQSELLIGMYESIIIDDVVPNLRDAGLIDGEIELIGLLIAKRFKGKYKQVTEISNTLNELRIQGEQLLKDINNELNTREN